jgi:hypothetical protein
MLGILRVLLSARRRCSVDVSMVDTGVSPNLLHRPSGVSRTTDPIDELLPERAPERPRI